jgi:hypothetical protein
MDTTFLIRDCSKHVKALSSGAKAAKRQALAQLFELLHNKPMSDDARDACISAVASNLTQSGMVGTLVPHLRSGIASVAVQATVLVECLLATEQFRDQWVKESGALETLIDMLCSTSDDVLLYAGLAIRRVAEDSLRKASLIAAAGAIPKLVGVLQHSHDDIARASAAGALAAVVERSSCRSQEAAAAGALQHLSELSKSAAPEAQRAAMHTSLAIIKLMSTKRLQKGSGAFGIQGAVYTLARSTDLQARYSSVSVLHRLCKQDVAVFGPHVLAAGGWQVLLQALTRAGANHREQNTAAQVLIFLVGGRQLVPQELVEDGVLAVLVQLMQVQHDDLPLSAALVLSSIMVAWPPAGLLAAEEGAIPAYTNVTISCSHAPLQAELAHNLALLLLPSSSSGMAEQAVEAGAVQLLTELIRTGSAFTQQRAFDTAHRIAAVLSGDGSGQQRAVEAVWPVLLLAVQRLQDSSTDYSVAAVCDLLFGVLKLEPGDVHTLAVQRGDATAAASGAAGYKRGAQETLLVPAASLSPGLIQKPDDVANARAEFAHAGYSYDRSEDTSCAKCGAASQPGGAACFLCSACRACWYCSRECQKAHWKLHKPRCGGGRSEQY